MRDKISVKNYLEYLDAIYPDVTSSNWNVILALQEEEQKSEFFSSLIRKIIESTSEISDEDKVYVRRFFDMLFDEHQEGLQELKRPPKPKYSAEHAFDVIRTLNCSLEDKLKIAELFEYTE